MLRFRWLSLVLQAVAWNQPPRHRCRPASVRAPAAPAMQQQQQLLLHLAAAVKAVRLHCGS
jgi:hypothetical protein